jgi:hypothetical protein
MVNGDHLQGMMVWHGFGRIQSETTVRQKMGRTLWWLASRDGDDDGENSPAMLIQESKQLSVREDRVDLGG